MLADKERERCQIGGWPKKGTALGVRRLDTALDVSFAPRSKHPKRCPATALQKANHTVNRRLNGYWRGRESRSSVSGRRPSRAVSCRVAWSVVYGKSRRTSAHALSGGSCAGWRGHRPGGPAPNQLEVLKEPWTLTDRKFGMKERPLRRPLFSLHPVRPPTRTPARLRMNKLLGGKRSRMPLEEAVNQDHGVQATLQGRGQCFANL